MSNTLHQLAAQAVDQQLVGVSEEEKAAVVLQIETKVKQEVLSEQIDELTMAQAKKRQMEEQRYRAERLRISISQAKEALFAAGIIGVLIGLLANQLTDLISLWKGVSPSMPLGWTAGACVLLLGANAFAFYMLYVRKIVGIVREHVQKDEGR